MENGGKKLPRGVWIFIPQIPRSSTSAALAEFFKARGFEISAEQISVRQRRECGCAMLSIPNHQVPELLAWLLEGCVNGEKFHGQTLQFSPVSTWADRRA
jgi:hypothetical protein